MIITGQAAIDYATTSNQTLNKYADPIEEARAGLTIEEAEEVAREDASLIWINVQGAEAGRYTSINIHDINDFLNGAVVTAEVVEACADVADLPAWGPEPEIELERGALLWTYDTRDPEYKLALIESGGINSRGEAFEVVEI